MVMVLCDELQERLGAAAARSEGGGRGAAGDGWAGLHAAGRGHALRRHQLRPHITCRRGLIGSNQVQ